MPGLFLHMSNQLERLADRLAELLAEPLGSPFEKEVIVVQSRGMERWLRMALAERLGISANLDFPFPNAFLAMTYSLIVTDRPLDDEYERNTMIWKIMGIISDCLDLPDFRELRRYLGPFPDDQRLYQLSKYIASCFDQYVVFRPEMILGWEEGRGKHWQAALWRKLTQGREPIHKARARKVLLKEILAGRTADPVLPERVSIFGISSLPPYHISIMAALSKLTNVHFFVMNPCSQYWFDIVSERKVEMVIKEGGLDYGLAEKLHLETGNGLLASMGHLGKDFISLLMDLDPVEDGSFHDPGCDTMLHAVQSDILNLTESGVERREPISIREEDSSISIHSCHSPLREMEVLYDRLLDIFNESPDIAPKDIVVMAPDITQYAPFIDAVFGSKSADPRAIPYSIADRGYMASGELAPALFHLFDLVESRFTANSILSFLERGPVKKRFSLSDKDVMAIRAWIADTRVHWGADEAMKEDLGLPPIKENTWAAALERLLLGYALPGQGKELFKGILPYDNVEGESAIVLGRLASFISSLVQTISILTTPASPHIWAERLSRALEEFFLLDEASEHEFQALRSALADLQSGALKAGYKQKVSFRVIKEYLKARIDEAGLAGGFLSKGVTFCSILPMRSIPFKVVCLVGMNHDAYPRHSRELAFDLMAARPRKGDRSKRNDDRYLFLESILSARKYFVVTYVGQSEADNSSIPPSPLVSELIDYLERNFDCTDGKVRDRVLIKHRLRPFNFSYFHPESNLYTYFDENLEAARLHASPEKAPREFFKEPLPLSPGDMDEISIKDLESFLANPARFILRRRLKINLRDEVAVPPDQEPPLLRGLEAYWAGERIVRGRLSVDGIHDLPSLLKAEGLLPHGNVGVVELERRFEEMEGFCRAIGELMAGAEPRWLDIDTTVQGHRIYGRVGEMYGSNIVHYRYAKLRAQDYLRLWLHHLLACLEEEDSAVTCSYLCGKDGWWVFKGVENPHEYLDILMDLYIRGVTAPVKFFPESSFAYARKATAKAGSDTQAMRSARETWVGSRYNRGEKEDGYLKLCFGEGDPLDEEFVEISMRVFSPLLAHMEKV